MSFFDADKQLEESELETDPDSVAESDSSCFRFRRLLGERSESELNEDEEAEEVEAARAMVEASFVLQRPKPRICRIWEEVIDASYYVTLKKLAHLYNISTSVSPLIRPRITYFVRSPIHRIQSCQRISQRRGPLPLQH